MANQWLRLWHDMPNDPKWRTVARLSGQSISSVLAVYLHVLVNASNATERGRTQSLNSEDIASALDLDGAQVDSILSAMQGRVLEGDRLSGWEKRQPNREDGSADRAKAWRERRANANERTTNAEERPDKDKDKDKDKEDIEPIGSVGRADQLPRCDVQAIVDLYHEILPELPRVRLMNDSRKKAISSIWRFALTSKRGDGTRRATNAGEAAGWIGDYFRLVRENDFLMGRGFKAPGHEGWQCDLDFLLTERGKKHVIEKTQVAA